MNDKVKCRVLSAENPQKDIQSLTTETMGLETNS